MMIYCRFFSIFGQVFSSYVRIQVVVLKTYLGWWTIGRSGERGSGISVLPARYDDGDDDCLLRMLMTPKFLLKMSLCLTFSQPVLHNLTLSWEYRICFWQSAVLKSAQVASQSSVALDEYIIHARLEGHPTSHHLQEGRQTGLQRLPWDLTSLHTKGIVCSCSTDYQP